MMTACKQNKSGSIDAVYFMYFLSFKNKIQFSVLYFFYKCCWLMLKQSESCVAIYIFLYIFPFSVLELNIMRSCNTQAGESNISFCERFYKCILYLSASKQYPKFFSFMLFQRYIYLWNLPGFFWGLNDL